MIRAVHISNDRRRDAQVAFDAQVAGSTLRRVLPSGQEPVGVRIVKNTARMNRDLQARYGVTELAKVLVEEDPDVDLELTGRKLRRTRRIFVDEDYRIVYHVNLFQIVRNPDGSQRELRELAKVPGNVNGRIPLRWTGRMYDREEILRRFAFSHSYQLRHVNGATFDFLYSMAKELHQSDAMVLIGAGKKGTEPILLNRGRQPYRGLLEGRVEGDKYCLIFHLTDIELKGLDSEEKIGEP